MHFLVPKIGNFAAELYPDIAYIKYLVFINLYATAIPYYFALYQTFKLLNYIDKNNAFSELSVQALKNIKYSALAISVLYVLGMPLFISWQREMMPWHYYYRNDYDFSSMVIAVFAAVLQRLLKDAIDIKSENDLTV